VEIVPCGVRLPDGPAGQVEHQVAGRVDFPAPQLQYYVDDMRIFFCMLTNIYMIIHKYLIPLKLNINASIQKIFVKSF
jgi:hypothetical protein